MILGLHYGHDASAAVIDQSGVRFAVENERFNRIKHTADFPFESVSWCLQQIQKSGGELTGLAIPRSRIPEETLVELGGHGNIADYSSLTDHHKPSLISRGVASLRNDPYQFPTELLDWFSEILSQSVRDDDILLSHFKQFEIPTELSLYPCHHHEAHAASAYYTSGFRDSLVVTLDGIGEGLSGTIWHGHDGEMRLLKTFPRRGSLGWFYAVVTEALGWRIGNGEGKTMGLASFIEPTEEVIEALRAFCPEYSNGRLVDGQSFNLQSSYTRKGSYYWSFGETDAVKELVDSFGRENVASAAQALLEDQVISIVEPWLKQLDSSTLATAGGVFTNVTLNKHLNLLPSIQRYHVFPAPHDGGLSVGAALMAQAKVGNLNKDSLNHVYLGPLLSDNLRGGRSISEMLDMRGIEYERPDDIVLEAARRLAGGQILAWCRGRMEFGPRALGNRSILIDPGATDSQDRVNQRVKFRESWRPFAPSVLAEAATEYFEDSTVDPFMIKSCNVPKKKRDLIPAVVHVDGTARPQYVLEETNPDYWRLIKAFADQTGLPVLLNTSYNLSGEPIIANANDAIRTFYDCGIDALVLDEILIAKKRDPTNFT
jgi:carbamoyltransferase